MSKPQFMYMAVIAAPPEEVWKCMTILGPSLSSPLAKAAVLKMFDQLGRHYLKERLYASTIPFRAT